MTEHFFTTWDGTRLFYRAWLPDQPAGRALVLFHRGHEHSGRFLDLVERLALPNCAVFAYDARGHGRSPGDRGWAESFESLVRDAESFVRWVSREYTIPMENFAICAHSIGAVIASVWVHDYAPPIRAMALASPAFRVKLYVPFALAFLRLRLKFQRKAFVKSYVRPGMLTHDPAESAAYSRDPLISRAVSVNLLVQMHDAATRLLADASAIRTPTLLLSSGTDYVVKLPPQRAFLDRLGAPWKEAKEYPGFFHDLLHEQDRAKPIAHLRDFLLRAFDTPQPPDTSPQNQEQYRRLSHPLLPLSPAAFNWRSQRLFLKTLGKLSSGIRLGWRAGFDSGESLDLVYRNQPEGITPLGRAIDRMYLDSPGWRGIRRRKVHVEELLLQAIEMVRASGRPVRIFDPAAGGGRYLLEPLSRLNGLATFAALRDCSQANVDAAVRLARQLNLSNVTAETGDAFHRPSLAGVRPPPTIAVVSGLYELFPDNAKVTESLLGLADLLPPGAFLIYTNQPWHPQLEMIARVLDNRDGRPWVMRCRPQAEMDALVRAAGFEKVDMRIDGEGIFSVSLARRHQPRKYPLMSGLESD